MALWSREDRERVEEPLRGALWLAFKALRASKKANRTQHPADIKAAQEAYDKLAERYGRAEAAALIAELNAQQ